MAITVKHSKVSTIPDEADTSLVRPSDWNADHTLTGLGTMAEQNANAVAITGGTMSGVTVTGYIPTTQKAAALGVATLDAGGTVPLSQIPASIQGGVSYQGTWNASTNTPTLSNGVGTKGYYYVVSVAGSTNLDGITSWNVGDWAIFNGTVWQKVDNTDAVTSVNGYTGTVVLGYGDITTGVVPVVNGGTGVTVSSGANSVVLRDSNVNINANAFNDAYTNTAASGTQIVLTAASVRRYTITGSGGQTIKLPDATTLSNGEIFEFDNNQSSGAITVNNNSNTLIVSVPSGGLARVNLLSNATAAGSWDRHDYAPANVSWSTNTFDYAGSITSATWNGSTVQVNRGGTGATTLTGYVKGSGTSALTAASTIPTTDLSGTVTNAQLANSAITINGTSTSLGGSISVGTVTSVAATAGTGISVSGSPITGSGTLTITNTAPDQTVAISSGTGISVTGTYPNFTVTNTSPSSGGTVTSVAALTLGTTGTDLSSTVVNGTTTPVITLQVPTASATNRGALSSTDWSTFNGKANAFTYTTNYIPYGQGTTTPTQSANLTFNGTTLRATDITDASLTSGRVVYAGTGGNLVDSSSYTFDGTTETAPIQRASNGIITNNKTIGTSFTIPSTDNAMSSGPVTLSAGVTVTVSSGSRWVVL
jgi:hypothetical protein